MGKIITKGVIKTYKQLIKDIINDLGETLYLYYKPKKEWCPNCLIDKASHASKNIFNSSFISPITIFGNLVSPKSFTLGRCPVCKGTGELLDYSPVSIRGVVKWRPQYSEQENTPAGLEGENIVRVKAKKIFYEKIRDCDYAMIDGVRCKLMKPPIIRVLGGTDELVVAFFETVEIGSSIKEK